MRVVAVAIPDERFSLAWYKTKIERLENTLEAYSASGL